MSYAHYWICHFNWAFQNGLLSNYMNTHFWIVCTSLWEIWGYTYFCQNWFVCFFLFFFFAMVNVSVACLLNILGQHWWNFLTPSGYIIELQLDIQAVKDTVRYLRLFFKHSSLGRLRRHQFGEPSTTPTDICRTSRTKTSKYLARRYLLLYSE